MIFLHTHFANDQIIQQNPPKPLKKCLTSQAEYQDVSAG